MNNSVTRSSVQNRRILCGGNSRRGAAAVELAVLSPVLLLLFVIVMDFGRVFYYSQIVENSARAGALYESDPTSYATLYANVDSAVVADARNLNPKPTVSSAAGTDAAGNDYVRVTVSWTFHLISALPAVPATKTLSRTVQMRLIQ